MWTRINKFAAMLLLGVSAFATAAESVTDTQRLLKEQPKALGLAVPSMPPGSPGMESDQPIPYQTFLVQADGSARSYARH
jgi:hypothetical protein